MADALQKNPVDAWWLQYPTVKSSPERRDCAYLEGLMKSPRKTMGKDFAVIDVRGTDRVGGHVKDSFNYRAQDFYPEMEAFGERFKFVPEVFFYCGSSNGRGPRVAGWYQDWLDSHEVSTSKALVLTGGVKAWVERNAEDKSLTEDYNPIAIASDK